VVEEGRKRLILLLRKDGAPLAVPSPQEAAAARRDHMSTAETHRIRILVADDDPDVLALVRDVLEVQGFSVLEAPSGKDALRVAEEHDGPIHLLLSDVVMPGMHGPELADRLRAARPETKVLFMSAYTTELAAPYGVLAGDLLISKPFTVMGLVQRVRQTLGYQSPFAHPGAPKPRP
jgi:two-component system, cell cycle sensor histidine kinase and response regulator CckA